MPTRRLLNNASDLLEVAGVSVRRAALVLAREPNSPITRSMKRWGDDEKPYRHLIAANTPEAREWRRTVGQIIAHLECFDSDRPVYRGWSFPNPESRAYFMDLVRRRGAFVNRRVGMSASRSRTISTGELFLNESGMVWEIRPHRTARNVSAIFAAIGAKYPMQREVIFPRASRFVMAKQPRTLRVVRGGQILRVPYFVFKEI